MTDTRDMWPVGGITHIVGDVGRGKTTTLIRRANEAVDAGKRVYFASSEMMAHTLLECGLSIAVKWAGGPEGGHTSAWLQRVLTWMNSVDSGGVLVVDFARYPGPEEMALLATPNLRYHFMSAFGADKSTAKALMGMALSRTRYPYGVEILS